LDATENALHVKFSPGLDAPEDARGFMNSLSRRQTLCLLGNTVLATGIGSIAGCSSWASRPAAGTIPRNPGASYDVVVYGGTPSGIFAAIASSRLGARVLLIEPTNHIGGIVTSGHGSTDSIDYSLIGGLAAKFLQDIGKTYGQSSLQYTFEPHVAERIFNGYIAQNSITLMKGSYITAVAKADNVITSITLDDGTVMPCGQWIDASYEGDLMALSGAKYTIGREPSSQYGESLAGWGAGKWGPIGLSAYTAEGVLLPGISPPVQATDGEGDAKIMAYTVRGVLTTEPSNMVPLPMPTGYDPARYEGLRRFIKAARITKLNELMSSPVLPNNKCCLEGEGGFSLDYPNGGWNYPNANWPDRKAIHDDHDNYTKGWLYFLANDSSNPASLRSEMNSYGLAMDEFTDNNNWPWQMYVREGRRLIGQYVMTQADTQATIRKADSVALAQWPIDSHFCQCYAASPYTGSTTPKGIGFDGILWVGVNNAYDVPFRAMLPTPDTVVNLAVPVCLSASHVAFSSLRVEPLYMQLGEVAGVAAALALEENVNISQVNVATLQTAIAGRGLRC
jgi:FAD dependent oxidoreductase